MIRRIRLGSAALAALLCVLHVLACRQDGDTVIAVKVQLGAGLSPGRVVALHVTVEAKLRSAARDFSHERRSLDFPATLSIQLPIDIGETVRLDVRGLDSSGSPVAQGGRQVTIKAGKLVETEIWIECLGGACVNGDGGTSDGGDDAKNSDAPNDIPIACGNARVDPGETCDIAIAPGKAGACPPSNCDDGIACTTDTRTGTGCMIRCTYSEVRVFRPGDGCCPANGTNADDPDCSAACGNGRIEAGEACDRAIPAGTPGACPALGDCVDQDRCTTDFLISENTCAARCVHRTITESAEGDACCPAGATHELDGDCPVVCGNAVVESGELCDRGVKAGEPGACPTSCEIPDRCLVTFRQGPGCQAICQQAAVVDFVSGDGCCPKGGNRNVDSDCKAVCGNGVVEAGETCDRAIAAGQRGACPQACPDPTGCNPATVEGSAALCTARCVRKPVMVCSKAQKDGCCPTGCSGTTASAAFDLDCSATCGNGVVDPGEKCDTAISATASGTCPRTCPGKSACMTWSLLSAETCHARCEPALIVDLVGGDSCCPPGANHNVDADCPAVCGNGVVDTDREACDRAILAGSPGACPEVCPVASKCLQYTRTGNAESCTARCMPAPISSCTAGDGCCAPGCHAGNDPDCTPLCGNSVVERGETCDRGITAGAPGACAASCDDGDACTTDAIAGRPEDCTRTCSHSPITACSAGDRCCPLGCAPINDADCSANCGNAKIESGETCDPPTTCPTTCPDDGDPCTTEKIVGDSKSCTAACRSMPILTCTRASDRCCPTGCTSTEDPDCPPPPTNADIGSRL